MASAIRAPGHRSSPSILIVAALVALIPACSGKHSAGTKAILSGGKGFALVPARRFTVEKGSGPAFENSIRMMMLPVKCTSESEVVTLENFALASQDGVRYNGAAILDVNGDLIPGTSSCAVLGSYALHLWAAQDLFPGNPKSDDEFRRQQWVYLALRGPFNPKSQGIRPPAVEKFFTEAGSMPFKSGGPSLGAWDSFFNPCLSVDISKRAGFDKNRYFACEGSNYRSLAGNPDDRTLQMQIANASESMLYRMAQGDFGKIDTNGIERAVRLGGSSGQAGTFKSGVVGKAGTISQDRSQMKARYVGGQMIRNLGRLLFGPSNGRQRRVYAPLYSGRYNTRPARTSYVAPQNPTRTPPSSPVVTQDFRDGEADGFAGMVDDWEKVANENGDNFFVKNPDKVTSVEEYSRSSGRPISGILGNVLFGQYEQAKYSNNASISEVPIPSNLSGSGETERLRSLGYRASDDYPGWLKGGNTDPGGAPVKGPGVTYWKNPETGEVNTMRDVGSGGWGWYDKDDKVLASYDENGLRTGGHSEWDSTKNAWVPIKQFTPEVDADDESLDTE